MGPICSFNSTPHSSTGYSTYFLAHGREPYVPASVNLSTRVASHIPQKLWNDGMAWHNFSGCSLSSWRAVSSVSTTLTNMWSSNHINVEIWYGWTIPQHSKRNLTLTGLDLTMLSHQITRDLYINSWIWDILKLDQKLFTMIEWSLFIILGYIFSTSESTCNSIADSHSPQLYVIIWFTLHVPWTTWHRTGFCPCLPLCSPAAEAFGTDLTSPATAEPTNWRRSCSACWDTFKWSTQDLCRAGCSETTAALAVSEPHPLKWQIWTICRCLGDTDHLIADDFFWYLSVSECLDKTINGTNKKRKQKIPYVTEFCWMLTC